jgi:hypothetical protein
VEAVEAEAEEGATRAAVSVLWAVG